MTLIQAVILGIIQGVAEFLPISSSGHLVIAQKIMGLTTPPVAFDIWLHVATLGAIGWWLKGQWRQLEAVKLVIIGSIPAGIVGLVAQPILETIFDSLTIVGWGLVVTGVMLLITKRTAETRLRLTAKTALVIGLAQAVAILPGVSRSGSTIATALMLGVGRRAAMQFSLLLAIPAIAGAQALELNELVNNHNGWGVNLIGFGVAFIVGLMALKLLHRVLQHKQLHYFGWYCLIGGGGVLLWQIVR